MPNCNVCGKSNPPHIECVDPKVAISMRATQWIELMEDVQHYYKLLEAFDPGGTHRTDAAWAAKFIADIDAAIAKEMHDRQATKSTT